ncbi:Putative phosphatase [Caenispirillum salinarum AK4]|uniref:Putative phosphatase n=1 Tax=Caenispirillum salinarum AK4 TaxID=1238182 RepID=K9H7S1_9PROT|nr:PhoX family phosphatase [Caenispirillum salinarum]EKV26623.1 Putative phosphatase [Caenispirillum salinarum AK4]
MTEHTASQFVEVVNDDDDVPAHAPAVPTMGDLVAARVSRRATLKGLSVAAAMATVGGAVTAGASREALAASASTLTFKELPHGYDEYMHVADGYNAGVLIRWGDAVTAGAPDFDVNNLTADAQKTQFGYNNDYIGFFPLPQGSNNSTHGLLAINHEYTDRHMMFDGIGEDDLAKQTKEMVDVEMAAHGHTVIEVKKDGDTWTVVPGSQYARRITALDTPMELTGPAAGHDRLKTSADSTGRKVIGTLNNCAGGETPWGTVLFAEENFHGYFKGTLENHPEKRNYERYGIKDASRYAWADHHDRFDLNKEPNEANRFGWMVEYDPYDPNSVPKKRTALGRFKHEGATTIVNPDGRLIVYTGDDQRFDYVYKYVSNGTVDTEDRAANGDLLDDGVLYVGKFDADGTLMWMPLVHGEGPLTAENGFNSQADVLIETRRAADLLGATPMDRPEDVEPNPATSTVFMMLTNNTKRKDEQTDAANPRAANKHGHVIEMIPPGGTPAVRDHASQEFTWDIFLMAGNPANPEDGAQYASGVTENGWLSCPDNVAFDKKGRIWITTDGAPKSGLADGVWAADVEGHGRALTRHFFRTPRGAEMCGPCFTPDDTTLFVAVQHPGDESGSSFANPVTRWPDFTPGMPPRPSVVAITKKGGGVIGS